MIPIRIFTFNITSSLRPIPASSPARNFGKFLLPMPKEAKFKNIGVMLWNIAKGGCGFKNKDINQLSTERRAKEKKTYAVDQKWKEFHMNLAKNYEPKGELQKRAGKSPEQIYDEMNQPYRVYGFLTGITLPSTFLPRETFSKMKGKVEAQFHKVEAYLNAVKPKK